MKLRSAALRLNHLPPELLSVVAEHLGTEKSVVSFSLVCRSFAEIASADEVWAPVARAENRLPAEVLALQGHPRNARALYKSMCMILRAYRPSTPLSADAMGARVRDHPVPDLNEFVFSYALHFLGDGMDNYRLANGSCRYDQFRANPSRFRVPSDGGGGVYPTEDDWPGQLHLWNKPNHVGFRDQIVSVPDTSEVPAFLLHADMDAVIDPDLWENLGLVLFVSHGARAAVLYTGMFSGDFEYLPGRSSLETDPTVSSFFAGDFIPGEKKLAEINDSTFPDRGEDGEDVGLDAGDIIFSPRFYLDGDRGDTPRPFQEEAGVVYCNGGDIELAFQHKSNGHDRSSLKVLKPEELAYFLDAFLDQESPKE